MHYSNFNTPQEMLELRTAIVEKDGITSDGMLRRAASISGGGTALEQWRAHESRVEIAAQRAEIEEVRRAMERMQRELEASLRETTSANEAYLGAAKEIESLRGKLMLSEDLSRNSKSRTAEVESELRRLNQKVSEHEAARRSLEEECAHLKASLISQEADMDAYFRAKDATPSKSRLSQTFDNARISTISGGVNAPQQGTSGGGLFQSPVRNGGGGGGRGNSRRTVASPAAVYDYEPRGGVDVYEILSSSDEESDDSGAIQPGRLHVESAAKKARKNMKTSTSATATTTRRGKHAVLTGSSVDVDRPFYGDRSQQLVPARFAVSQLEVAAAEIVALVLLQEIQYINAATASATSGNAGGSNVSGNLIGSTGSLKDACLRAALRVVHSSTTMARTQLHQAKQGKQQQQRSDKG